MAEGSIDFFRGVNMLRLLIAAFFLSACSMNTVKTGGEHSYRYDPKTEYSSTDLRLLAKKVVETSFRDPPVGRIDALFSSGQHPLKRVGIVVFETQIQPTREGIAKGHLVYLSESGKQIMTENFLRLWQESTGILAPDVNFATAAQIKKAKAFQEYGLAERNYINARRSSLAPDDIFYLEAGRRTTTTTVVNPRGMRDMSFLLVPAYELMGGPKWSEHNKQFVNALARELNLDAVLVIMSEVHWTAAQIDKHSGESVPEEIRIKLKASTLVPFSSYHQRLRKIHVNQTPQVTLCYRSYESELRIPVRLTVPEEGRRFEHIESELLAPVMKTYKDLAQMTIIRIRDDLEKTW